MSDKVYRVLVSAGDHSGDLILSKIVSTLKSAYGNKIEFEGLAGPVSIAAGVKKVADTKDVAVVGIVEVLKNIRKIFGVLGDLNARLDSVDSVLCVDFPDFNMKLASMAKKKGVPVDYVVAPQVWAWRSKRLPRIKSLVRKLYPALPFEQEIFLNNGVDAKFMGHPIRDSLPPRNRRVARETLGLNDDEFVFCIMPGSRSSEISRHLKLLVKAWERLKFHSENKNLKICPEGSKLKAILPVAQGWSKEEFLSNTDPKTQKRLSTLLDSGEWTLVYQSHLAQMASDFGWIASGTASLEAAYYQLPHVLYYKLSGVSAFIINSLTSYFSDPDSSAGLPNILLKRKVVPELLQGNLNADRLAIESLEILSSKKTLSDMQKSLRFLPKQLGEAGASYRIAEDLQEVWNLKS